MRTHLLILGLAVLLQTPLMTQDAQLLIPHLTTTLRQQMANPVTGFLVFDTDTKSYWYYQDNKWFDLTAGPTSDRSMPPSGDHVRVEIGGKEKVRVDSIHLSVMFPDSSTVIGYDAGANNAILTNAGHDDQGKFNTFIGIKAGFANNPNPSQCSAYNYFNVYEGGCGCHNTFVGHISGYQNLYGRNNTFLGSHAGYFNKGTSSSFTPGFGGPGSENTFMGFFSGYRNQNGFWNTFIGTYAGENNGLGTLSSALGRYNTYVGAATGRYNELGIENVYVGTEAGGHFDNTLGNRNVLLGYRAGYFGIGSDNVVMGHNAGLTSWPNAPNRNVLLGAQAGQTLTGNDNVFIGYQAGRLLSNTQNTLIIGNTTTNQLIYGEFNNGLVRINGRLESTSTSEASLNNNGALTLGNVSGSNMTMDLNEIQARFDSTATTLQLQPAGGQLIIGSTIDAMGDKLLVETGTGLSPLRARVAGATKLRVHGNGGTSLGVNTTPPTDGLFVAGNVEVEGTRIDGTGHLTLGAGISMTMESGSSFDLNSGTSMTLDASSSMLLESVQTLTIKVGTHMIQIHPSAGITISTAAGADLTIDSGGDLMINADGNMTLDANTITLNGSNGGVQRAARVNSLVTNPPCTNGCVGTITTSGTSASVFIGN